MKILPSNQCITSLGEKTTLNHDYASILKMEGGGEKILTLEESSVPKRCLISRQTNEKIEPDLLISYLKTHPTGLRKTG